MNNSTNSSNLTRSVCSSKIKDVQTMLYSIVVLAAISGNMFIIVVVYRKKSMRKTTNIFIANIAASDMLVSLITIPRIIVELYTEFRRWFILGTFGEITCKLFHFVAQLSVCITILSHMLIAIDRFWAIVYSLRSSPITPARRKYIIALTWLFSFIWHSPYLYSLRMDYSEGKAYCILEWYPLDTFIAERTYFTWFLFGILFCIPTIVIITLYTKLVLSLITGKNDASLQTSQIRRRRKEDITVFRKVVILLAIFLISWIPINILSFIYYYSWNGETPCNQSAFDFSFAAFFIFLSNTAVNPWVCIMLNKSFKRQIRKIFSWKYIMKVTSRLKTSSLKNKNSVNADGEDRSFIALGDTNRNMEYRASNQTI